MNATNSFGVLESSWEMELAGPAGESQSAPNLTDEELGSLPFKPALLSEEHLGENVQHRHMQQVKFLTTGDGQREPGPKVPTQALVTQYGFPNDTDQIRAIILTQYVPPSGNRLVYRVAAGMTRQVKVNDQEGLLIQGHWYAEAGATTAHWVPTGAGTVLWSIEDRAFSLYGEGFEPHEILELASTIHLASEA